MFCVGEGVEGGVGNREDILRVELIKGEERRGEMDEVFTEWVKRETMISSYCMYCAVFGFGATFFVA